MLRFARLLVFFLRVLFHVLWLRWLVSILLSKFPPAAVLAVPSCFSPPFRSGVFLSVLWTSSWVFHFLRPRLFFAFAAPPVVFHTAGSPLAVPRLSRCCLPCILLVFFRLSFLRLLRVSSLSLGLRSLSWCLFLLVFLVVFFTPVLVHSPLVLPCSVAVAFVCLFF